MAIWGCCGSHRVNPCHRHRNDVGYQSVYISQISDYYDQRFFFLYRKSRSYIVTLILSPLVQAESVRAISVRMKNTPSKFTDWLLALSQTVITITKWWVGCIKIHFSLSSICLGYRSVPFGTGCVLVIYFLNWWWFTGHTWRLNITIILQWPNLKKWRYIPDKSCYE